MEAHMTRSSPALIDAAIKYTVATTASRLCRRFAIARDRSATRLNQSVAPSL